MDDVIKEVSAEGGGEKREGTGRLKGLYCFDDKDEMFRTAARVMLELCFAEIERKGYFTVVLSGGSTPLDFYAMLASEEYRARVRWKDIHFFWGDERCVPPDDELSNYGAAVKAMFSKVDVPEGNIHRMRGEEAPEKAAEEYENEIMAFFRERYAEEPSFDLVFLGLGEDGHTLSLFPGSPALAEGECLVVDAPGEASGPRRLTMTLPLVNSSGTCVFLVSGASKGRILKEVMEDDGQCHDHEHDHEHDHGHDYPASMVSPGSGNLVWFVDREAASVLHSE